MTDLAADRDGTGGLERTLRGQEFPQVGSADQAHRQVEPAADIPCVVDGHDVRMLERHRDLRLPGEALTEAMVECELGGHELEGDRSLQPEVVGAVDDAHATPADQLLDLVSEEL